MKWEISLSREEVIERLNSSFLGDYDMFQMFYLRFRPGIYGSVEQVENEVAFSLYVSMDRTLASGPYAHIRGTIMEKNGGTFVSAHYMYSIWACVAYAFLGILAVASLLSTGYLFGWPLIFAVLVSIVELCNVGQKRELKRTIENIFQGYISCEPSSDQ